MHPAVSRVLCEKCFPGERATAKAKAAEVAVAAWEVTHNEGGREGCHTEHVEANTWCVQSNEPH